MMMARNDARLRYLVVVLVGVALSGCGMYDDQPFEEQYGPDYETRRSQLTEFCEVQVDGYGTLSVEDEYLAQVVTCEHSGAPMETLKAQAIAARGYAKYIAAVENRALSPTVRDQAYECGRAATDRARQAVRETSGMVLTYNGKLTAPFYVAGSTAVNSGSCKASGSAGTQGYVTYNEGHIGSRVHTTSLGSSRSPANRGAMSQNGAVCLADKGWDASRILRFFYGDDIRVTRLPGSCVDSDADPANSGSTITPVPDPQPTSDPGTPSTPTSTTCDEASAQPHIIPRSAWGARAPRANRQRHSPNRFSIHHTESQNNDSTPARTVKNIQYGHMNDRGWSDIGYHYLIDQQGRIYAGSPVDRIGAHVGGHNTGNIGISFLGHYGTAQPTEGQLMSAGKLIRHLSDRYGISPSASNVKGHRDQGSSSCPGDNLYAQIGRIIRHAKGEADVGCDDSPSDDDPANDDEPQTSGTLYNYVKVRATSADPTGDNDTIAGFELDSVFAQSAESGTNHLATGVQSSSGATNPNAVTGAPDNTTCEDRASTVAGIETGGEVVIQLAQGVKAGDSINIVQANYNVGLSDCTPSGAAEVSVSVDGTNWTLLSRAVSGNASLPIDSSYVSFIKPSTGTSHERLVEFKVDASDDVAEVEYLSGGWSMGRSTDDNFAFEYEFQGLGGHDIEARGYDSQGNMVANETISITVGEYGSGGSAQLSFIEPSTGSTHERLVRFEVDASRAVVEVEYLSGGWSMGRSTDNNFAFEYEFQGLGGHDIEARGYDSQGNMVANDIISITVGEYGSGDSGGGVDGRGSNSQMSQAFGDEGGTCSGVGNGGGAARCTNGRGGWSSGRCWAYVKAAMIRAGLATRADINQLASRVGMSGYSVQVSAAGFKRAADRASAGDLRETMGLRKVNVPVGQAPKGAVIAWAPGCRGYHSQYGHIEVAQGDGYACSDFCGSLKAHASCASVYVPTN
jgi:hypothetical protein